MMRERLEALASDELRLIAEHEGIDVPDDVERVLLIDLILEVIEENRLEREMANNSLIRGEQMKYDLAHHTAVPEKNIPVLANTYPETRVVLLLRDPYWAFAYWDLKALPANPSTKETNGDSLLLRVVQLEMKEDGARTVDSFDIPVGFTDRSWYINIPSQGGWYRADLVFAGKGSGAGKVLGQSNVIRVQGLPITGNGAYEDDPLMVLSGWGELEAAAADQPSQRRINGIDDDLFT